jgi:hypothetical protein
MAKTSKMYERNDEWDRPPPKNANQTKAEPSPRRGEYDWKHEGHGGKP